MIYLNNAATSYPKPKIVLDALSEYLSSPPFLGSRGGLSFNENIVDETREKLKTFLNADSKDKFVFTSGATESLNIAINSLELHDCKVLATNSEHNSVNRPLKTLEKNNRVQIEFIEANKDGAYDIEQFANSINNDVRAIFLNHCSNVTGLALNIAPIAELARQNGAKIIIDASQSIGGLPIDINELRPDFLAYTSHKSLYGLQGSGGLYIKDPASAKPLKIGGTGSRSDYLLQPDELPQKFEAGTQNIPAIIALNAGLDFINDYGFENIHQKKVNMSLSIISELERIERVRIIGDKTTRNRTSTLSFLIDGFEPNEIILILEENFDIKARAGLHCAPLIHKSLETPNGTARISPSIFTSEEEIEKFIDAIKEISNA